MQLTFLKSHWQLLVVKRRGNCRKLGLVPNGTAEWRAECPMALFGATLRRRTTATKHRSPAWRQDGLELTSRPWPFNLAPAYCEKQIKAERQRSWMTRRHGWNAPR
jgi:hypothetical protein